MSQQEPVSLKFTSEITIREVMQVGSDSFIAAAAWVSTSAGEGLQRAMHEPEKVSGLLRYLMQHRHGTPFEHGMLTLYVHAPIFVWREWHRHRIGHAFNEESARYKVLEPVFYIPSRDRPMVKVDNWKPGRPKFMTLDQAVAAEFTDGVPSDAGDFIRQKADERYAEIVADMKAGYEEEYPRYLRQLARNLDPGLARDNLPVGIYSSCWVTVNPRSLMHFLSLRTHEPTAQKVSYPLYEIDSAARQVESLFAKNWPMTHAAFNAFGRVAP